MADDKVQEYVLRPVGVVRSPVGVGDRMPIEGVPATVELFPQYAEGLKGIESNTHLMVLGWFHLAPRDELVFARHGGPPHGVFGLRSPGRPNPIGLTSARVTAVEGLRVHLDRLDMIDGTPVADIKRYSPGWDSIFCARTSRELDYPQGRDPVEFLKDMVVEAVNFHGEACVGVALGTRMVDYAMHTWRIGKKDPGLWVGWGPDGCIDDALQAVTGATAGNRRLRLSSGPGYTLGHGAHTLTFSLQAHMPQTVPEVLQTPVSDLLNVRLATR